MDIAGKQSASQSQQAEANNNRKTEKSEQISKCQLYIFLGVIWGFIFLSSIWCAYNFNSLRSSQGLDKTAFAFVAGIFISSLIFTDSVLKTYKYGLRANESLAGNILQTITLAALGVWTYLSK